VTVVDAAPMAADEHGLKAKTRRQWGEAAAITLIFAAIVLANTYLPVQYVFALLFVLTEIIT
jgi:hypothetical protein